MRIAVIGWVSLVMAACSGPSGGGSPEAAQPAAHEPVTPADEVATGEPSESTPGSVPEHQRRWPGLFVRDGDRIVDAPPGDEAVARGYPGWADKGPVVGGRRITLMTARTEYEVGEEVRVIHVFEATEAGQEVYVMGPKPVHGEYVDGRLATSAPPTEEYPWLEMYDGAVLPSPALDYNYEITSYRLSTPGEHRIQWRVGGLVSNELVLTVRAPDPDAR